jgi:anthranilate phosphoribosyltransferase
MRITGPEESAAIIRRVLSGERGPCRDVVVLNAAAALWTAGVESSLIACAERAGEAIDSGRASALLLQWSVLSLRL